MNMQIGVGMKTLTHFNIARLSLEKKDEIWDMSEREMLYRMAFCLGAALPDLSITRFIHPHFYKKSAAYVFDKLTKINDKPEKTLLDALELGKMVHYLSDFCCYVHRTGDVGDLMEHEIYESKLNFYVLKQFKKLRLAGNESIEEIIPIQNVIEQIKNKLTKYHEETPCFELDILHSVNISSIVYHGILQFHEEENEWKENYDEVFWSLYRTGYLQ